MSVARNRSAVLAVVLTLLALPVVLAIAEAAHYRIANRNNGSMLVAAQKREYLLYVPARYDRNRPAPLVISMHAAALWPAAQRAISQWNRLADREGFIVVYPSGLEAGGPTIWNVSAGGGLARDVAFISSLIDTLQAHYNIDAARIYANGLSNGGGMSFALSCTLATRIAAVGVVSSAQTLPFSWCPDQRPVPLIAFHGTADPVTPYAGGPSWISSRAFPNIPTWVANWARRNRCAASPMDTLIASAVSRTAYAGCAPGADVVFYTMLGGGHTWPGGRPLPQWLVGPANDHIDATVQLWAFFREHPRVE